MAPQCHSLLAATRPRRSLQSYLCVLALVLSPLSITTAAAQDFITTTVKAFAESDIVFKRSGSNAPYFPVAQLTGYGYGDASIALGSTDRSVEFRQSGVSAFAMLPQLMSKRDALITGAYVSSRRFDTDNGLIDDFRVDTLGLPLGWFRQVNAEWQAAAFVMPLGHRSTQDDSDWTLQTMGGAFTRYTQNERLWWAFGLFADHSPNDSYVLPYLGASWVINPRWTVSAIMPWPAIVYAPTPDWMFSLGASPSGASWSLQPAANEVAVSLDAWDFGINAERRLYRNLWVSARVGVGGLRGLRLNSDSGSVEDPEINVSGSGFFALSLKIRPGLLP
jgi:hypothetical protein